MSWPGLPAGWRSAPLRRCPRLWIASTGQHVGESATRRSSACRAPNPSPQPREACSQPRTRSWPTGSATCGRTGSSTTTIPLRRPEWQALRTPCRPRSPDAGPHRGRPCHEEAARRALHQPALRRAGDTSSGFLADDRSTYKDFAVLFASGEQRYLAETALSAAEVQTKRYFRPCDQGGLPLHATVNAVN